MSLVTLAAFIVGVIVGMVLVGFMVGGGNR